MWVFFPINKRQSTHINPSPLKFLHALFGADVFIINRHYRTVSRHDCCSLGTAQRLVT